MNPFDPNNPVNQARETMRRQQETLRRQQEHARQMRDSLQRQQESTRRLQEFGRQQQETRRRAQRLRDNPAGSTSGNVQTGTGASIARVIGMLMFIVIVVFLAFFLWSVFQHPVRHR